MVKFTIKYKNKNSQLDKNHQVWRSWTRELFSISFSLMVSCPSGSREPLTALVLALNFFLFNGYAGSLTFLSSAFIQYAKGIIFYEASLVAPCVSRRAFFKALIILAFIIARLWWLLFAGKALLAPLGAFKSIFSWAISLAIGSFASITFARLAFWFWRPTWRTRGITRAFQTRKTPWISMSVALLAFAPTFQVISAITPAPCCAAFDISTWSCF